MQAVIINSKTKRGVARRQWLRVLTASQDYKCFWCGGAVVCLSALSVGSIISRDHHEVRWRDGEHAYSAGLATIDHVIPLCKGGSNRRANLVVACVRCNEDRGIIHDPRPNHLTMPAPQRRFGTNLGEVLRLVLRRKPDASPEGASD